MWGDAPSSPGDTAGTVSFQDPRLPALGLRVLAEARFASDVASATNGLEATPDDYHAHRIALGVPEGGKDYAFGDAFPHEADLDQLARRILHQGLLRRPGGGEPHAEPRERSQARRAGDGRGAADARRRDRGGRGGDRQHRLGRGTQALALVRLDRAAEAMAKGDTLTAGGVAITLRKPDWATFDLAPARRAGAP